MKDLDRNGVWFFPENPDQQYFGKVTFSSSIGAELELYGLGGQPVSKAFVEVIHGYIEGETGENVLVTLLKCNLAKDSLPAQGIPKTKFYATYLFQGKHYNSIAEVKFNKVLVDYNHLDSWINIPNFRRELTNDNQTINVTQIVKGSQELGKLLNFSISIVFFPSGMYRDLYKTVDNDQDSILIEDHKSILIESDAGELSSFNDFLDVINNFKDFLTFACNQVFIVTRVRFFVKIELDQPEVDPIQWEQLFQYFVSGDLVAYDKATNCRKKLAHKTIEVNLYTLTNSQNINEKFNRRNVLFYYTDINGNTDNDNSVIDQWDKITDPDQFKYIIEIYLSLFYIPTHHYRNLFLNLAQAIEGFHRKQHGEKTFCDEKTFKAIKNKLKDCMKEQIKIFSLEEYEDSLQGLFQYSNQWSFRDRLKDTFNKYQDFLYGSLLEEAVKNKCINDVVKIRNNMTHLVSDKGKSYNWPTNKEFEELSYQLKIILEVCFLKELGFTSEQTQILLARRV